MYWNPAGHEFVYVQFCVFSCVMPLIIPCKNLFTKIIFHSFELPLVCIWKNIFTKLNFHFRVPLWYSLNFLLFLRLRLILLFWDPIWMLRLLLLFWEITFLRNPIWTLRPRLLASYSVLPATSATERERLQLKKAALSCPGLWYWQLCKIFSDSELHWCNLFQSCKLWCAWRSYIHQSAYGQNGQFRLFGP